MAKKVKVKEIREYEDLEVDAPPASEKARVATVTVKPRRQVSSALTSEDDKIAQFLAELDSEIEYTLFADRLPEYGRDGRSDPRAVHQSCGRVPFSPQSPHEYVDWLRDTFGGGHYRMTLRGKNGRILKQWVVSIAAPQKVETALAPVQPSQVEVKLPQQPNDLDHFIETAERLRKLVDVFQAKLAPQQPVVQNPQPEVQLSFEQRIAEKLVEGLASSGDVSLLERVVARALGEEAKPSSDWVSLVKELVVPVVPLLVQAAAARLQPQVAQSQLGLLDQTATSPQLGSNPPQPEHLNLATILVNRLREDYRLGLSPEPMAVMLLEAADQAAEVRPLLAYISSTPTPDLARHLGIGEDWLNKLKEHLLEMTSDESLQDAGSTVASVSSTVP